MVSATTSAGRGRDRPLRSGLSDEPLPDHAGTYRPTNSQARRLHKQAMPALLPLPKAARSLPMTAGFQASAAPATATPKARSAPAHRGRAAACPTRSCGASASLLIRRTWWRSARAMRDAAASYSSQADLRSRATVSAAGAVIWATGALLVQPIRCRTKEAMRRPRRRRSAKRHSLRRATTGQGARARSAQGGRVLSGGLGRLLCVR